MKLPPDYKLISLSDLKRVVALLGTGSQMPYNEELEMTTEQYGAYKRLVWLADPIRYYQGMEIKLSTDEPTKKGDGSV